MAVEVSAAKRLYTTTLETTPPYALRVSAKSGKAKMATVLHKQSCPTCGQSCNVRVETLSKNLVMALFRVAKWAQEKNITDPVKRSEFAHLVAGTEANTANFAKLAWFAPQFFLNLKDSGEKKQSYYHFDLREIGRFFACHTEIATIVEVNPLAKGDARYVRKEFRRFNQIPSLLQFLDNEREYIVEYLGRAHYPTEQVQRALFVDKF